MPTKSKWCVELTVYQDQLHLVTFWGVTECKSCMLCVCIHGWVWCAVEKAPTGSQLLTMLFFFELKKSYNFKIQFGSEKCAKSGNLDLWTFIKDWNGKFWLRKFGSTYLCNRLSHRWLGEGEGGYGWLCRCSYKDSHFSMACTAVLVMDDDDDDGGAVRTYNCGMPHCRWMNKWWGLTVVWCLIHFLVGGEGLSSATSPSWATVWDLCHFPLVALPVPPRYILPKSSLDSCLAQTSNVVQASLAMLPLKNLHLRHSQMAAARSWVGPYHGSHARDTTWGSRTFSSWDSLSSAVIFLLVGTLGVFVPILLTIISIFIPVVIFVVTTLVVVFGVFSSWHFIYLRLMFVDIVGRAWEPYCAAPFEGFSLQYSSRCLFCHVEGLL